MAYDDFDDEQPATGAIPPFILPAVTSAVALFVGTLFGAIVIWFVKPDTEVEVPVPRDYTDAELAQVCAPFVDIKQAEIDEANTKVASLKTRVAQKEAEIAKMVADEEKRKKAGAAAWKKYQSELEAAKAEARNLKQQLATAQEEKNRLVEELKETVIQLEETEQELEDQKVKTELAKEDALTNKWYRFINNSQLEICEKGGRKKMGKCREAVKTYLGTSETQAKFAHCVRSGQATPSVHELEKKAALPTYAGFLNQDDRIVKGWYLLMCDPTLPEAPDGFLREEEHLPGAKVSWEDAAEGGGAPDDGNPF